ncbi:MAG: putative conserved rane protein [Actinobacteria bacterium]|nr:putative conserved rane protein [Actinomycetota bacterium]
MSATLDTNVLIYAVDEDSDLQPRARALLDHVATRPAITYLFWPVLMGYLRIITHPSILRSPLDLEAAIEGIDDLVRRPQIVVPGEGDRFWSGFRSVASSTPPRGVLVPDAHVVALMHEHGVGTIWSRDRDFRKFDGVTVLDPFDDRFSAGFEV